MRRNSYNTNASLTILLSGLTILSFGALFYLFTRGCAGCPLESYSGYTGPSFGAYGPGAAWLFGWLPTAIHVIGFSLITNAVLTSKNELKGFCVGIWVLANLFFEILQADLPQQAWRLVNMELGMGMASYWPMRGTFSASDMAAACAGGVLAYVMLSRMRAPSDSGQNFKIECIEK